MEIKFNILGIILNGANPEEEFIRIIDDQKNTGGFLVLLSSNDKFLPFNSYDDWIGNLEVSKECLQESNWTIKWPQQLANIGRLKPCLVFQTTFLSVRRDVGARFSLCLLRSRQRQQIKKNVINHVEKYIGTISHGLESGSGSQYKLNIAAIPSSPNRDSKIYITLGLGKHDLNYKSRFEIFFVCSLKYDENRISPFLRWLAETTIENKRVLLREQVIYLPRSTVDSTKMDALYVPAPFYFDDDFQVCHDEHYNIVFPLLVPLYKQGAESVEERGWNAFEQFLLDSETDNLSDMNRRPFIW